MPWHPLAALVFLIIIGVMFGPMFYFMFYGV
jgi:hypothetical protein